MRRVPVIVYVALLLVMQSCIKEDLDDCSAGLLLRFRYTLNDQQTNLFGTNIHKITVYIFDKEGKYVDMFSESGDKLTSDYIMQIPLPEGSYDVVAYGGDFTTYTTGELDPTGNEMSHLLRKGVTDMKDFRMLLNNVEDGTGFLLPVKVPDDLYAGMTVGALSVSGQGKVTEVELIQDTKKVKVILTGINVLSRAQAVPDIYITALNGRYTFDNRIDGAHRTLKYVPLQTSVDLNRIEANLKTMRLVIGTSPMLVIKDPVTGSLIYHKNLIEQILQNPNYSSQTDLDREDEFVFEIALEAKDHQVIISVTINGWKINEVNPVTE